MCCLSRVSSVGRAPSFQVGCREFEPRTPLKQHCFFFRLLVRAVGEWVALSMIATCEWRRRFRLPNQPLPQADQATLRWLFYMPNFIPRCGENAA